MEACVKNLRKHVNEFDQARHRYEIMLQQKKRTEERKRLAHSGASQEETRSSLFKVHPKA